MPFWKLETENIGREVYVVEADTAEAAEAKLDAGDVPVPQVSEVLSVESVTTTAWEG